MEKFKVFYSWQSDLPGNTNRYFLDSCINEAVNNCNSAVEGIEIVADRDTKGITGSPNITQTIFEKIDGCDLFVADVSIVNSHIIKEDDSTNDALDMNGGTAAWRPNDSKKNKFRYTPNPNVLIELGYAVKCLGWERIICFMNTVYGGPEKLPFDLDHQRVTGYSLNDQSDDKSKVKKSLRGIVTDTILILSKTNRSQRKGKSYHVVGTYDPENRKLDADLVAYDVRAYNWIEEYFRVRKEKSRKLMEEIKAYKIPVPVKKQKPIIDENDPIEKIIGIQKALGFDNNTTMVDYAIGSLDRDTIRDGAAKYLNMDPIYFDEDFFNVGNMKIQSFAPVMPWWRGELRKDGTDEELEKDGKIQELISTFTELEKLELYLKTFDNVLLFPLAIENNSEEMDTKLEVVVRVEGDCELITPSVDFINPDLKEDAANIYQTGFPRDLLYLQDGSDIKYENNDYLYYDPEKPFYGQVIAGLPMEIEDEEYGYAMENYIATPDSKDEYVFHLDSLRAKEKKWLGGIIAVKKLGEQDNPGIKMKYRILSDNTGGDLGGELVYKGTKR